MSMDCSLRCSRDPGDLEPNPDVGGIGVLIGFVGTAWFVVMLVILRYILIFDPKSDPFKRSGNTQGSGSRDGLRPNVIDQQAVYLCSKLRSLVGDLHRWELVFEQAFLTMCDVQLLTGLGILLSGYVGFMCYVSAYHWEVISYLAWFSNLTHIACLTVLRRHFYQNQVARNWRLAFMAILLVGLVTAIVPTAYFNWTFRDHEGTSSFQSSDARCYYSRSLAKTSWDHICSLEPEESNCHSSRTSLTTTSAYESCVMSILLLTFNFLTRSVKLSKTLTDIARNDLRERLGNWSISTIIKIIKRTHRGRIHSTKKKWPSVVLDFLLSTYIVGKLYIDIYTSELSDLFWLVVSAVWGTFRLSQIRKFAPDGDNQWGFGQILPVFLLAGPVVALWISIKAEGKSREDESECPAAHEEAAVVDFASRTIESSNFDAESLLAPRQENWQGETAGIQQPIELTTYAQNQNNAPSFPKRATPSRYLPFLTWDIVNEESSVEMRTSIHAHYANSHWMSAIAIFTCLQIAIATGIILNRFKEGKPTRTLEFGVSYHGFGHTSNCFIGIVYAGGLFPHGRQASKTRMFCIMVILWAISGVLFYFLAFVDL